MGYGYKALTDSVETFLDAVIAASSFSTVPVLRKGLEKAAPRTGAFILFSLQFADTVRPLVQGDGKLASGLKRSIGQIVCKIFSRKKDGGDEADQILDALADGIDARADSVVHPFTVLWATSKNGGGPSSEFKGLWQVNALTRFEYDRS